MATPKQPIFDLKDRFDGTISIGPKTQPIVIPISVKRFSKTEMEEFQREWDEFVEEAGQVHSPERTPEEQREHDRKLVRFYEARIRECITVEPGYLRDMGKDVIDGNGVLGMFHSRHDILAQFCAQIYIQNKLTGEIVKNLLSPLGSAIGSTASVLTNGELLRGAEPESVASSVESKDSASSEDAEERPDDSQSGPTPVTH